MDEESTYDGPDPDRVTDRKSFLEFVKDLADERYRSIEIESHTPSSPYGPEALGWENTRIDSFLDAAVSWAESAAQDTNSDLASPAELWRWFAIFLYCGKIYE